MKQAKARRTTGARASDAQAERSLPAELVAQLEAVIAEDPQKRQAKTLLLRALLKEALRGNLRAIKECLRIVEEVAAEQALESIGRPGRSGKRGRPRKEVDLDEVRRLASEGMWSHAQIARILRMTRKTLLRPEHANEVREAIEDGRALWAQKYLRLFNQMVRNRKFDPAILYATKQSPIGWSDRQTLVGSDGAPIPLEIVGAVERLVAAVQKYQQKRMAEHQRPDASISEVSVTSGSHQE